MARRTVRRDTAGPEIKSLTSCQANKTRVAVRTVRRDTEGPGMESLTFCQANGRTRVTVRTGLKLDLTWNHLLAVKPIEPEWQ